jgi:hypothetical protein
MSTGEESSQGHQSQGRAQREAGHKVGPSAAVAIYHLDVHRPDESEDPHWNNYLTLSRNSEGMPLLRPSYQRYLCPSCHTLDKDALFDRGFDEGPMIWMKGGQEIERTPDGFFCLHARVLALLNGHAVRGFETRPIPLTSWHAVRITEKVASAQKPGNNCKACGRASGHGGWDSLEELVLPAHDNTFFTTALESPSGCDYSIWHRTQQVFVTGRLAQILQAGRVKAGMLIPILSSKELDTLKHVIESGGRPRLTQPPINLM